MATSWSVWLATQPVLHALCLVVANKNLNCSSTNISSKDCPQFPTSHPLLTLKMASSSASFLWDVGIFSDCYNAIKFLDAVPEEIDALMGTDLRHLLDVPSRSDKARQDLAKGEKENITFADGLKYKLNKPFIESAYLLASELDLDELATAELLLLASEASFSKGSSLEDAGILAFFRRYDYILNIVGYMVTKKRIRLIYPTQDPAKELFQQCLKSFKKIYSLIQIQNDQIDRQKATADINNLAFVKKVYFVKQQLFQIHDLLSQILYFLIDTFPETVLNFDTYNTLVKHINENITNDSDILLLHYLPSLLRIVTGLEDLSDAEVLKIHQQFVSSLSADYPKVKDNDNIDLSKSSLRPYDLCTKIFFFIAFIPWCKGSDERTRKFDFKKDILQYIEWLISYGTTEQILCYAAETAVPETTSFLEQSELYDFRALLQRSFPLLLPAKFVYAGNDELLNAAKSNPQLSNVPKLCDFSSFKISRPIADDIIAPSFHSFFSNFVNHAAIVLTLLRDNEEDYLLSSNKKELDDSSRNATSFNDTYESLSSKSLEKSTYDESDSNHDLNDIASRADLERFYMACVYTYSNRSDLCEAFWAADESNVAGFVDWGISKNTLPLITATFCFLLGSLTSGGTMASLKVWDILVNANTFRKNDYSYISIDSIIGSLTYYLDALTENLELELITRSKMEQQKLEYLFSSNHHKRVTDDDTEIPIMLSEDSVVFIAGFFMLIAQILKNAGDEDQVSRTVRQSAFNRFHPIIVSFLKFDNLITSAKESLNKKKTSVPVVFSDENRTIILNLVMNCLKEFATTSDMSIRTQIWDTVDRWICHSLHDGENTKPTDSQRYTARGSLLNTVSNSTKTELQKLKSYFRGSPMKQGFQMALTKTSEVSNFVQLIAQLLGPVSNEKYGFNSMELLYPSNLGSGYRFKNQIGVWPYMEFILNEVFVHTPDLEDEDLRVSLQLIILKVVKTSLTEVDWLFLVETAPQIFLETPTTEDVFASSRLLSGETTAITFETFVRVHHSLSVLNFLFEDKPSAVLFNIVNTGLDLVSGNPVLQHLISEALSVVDNTLRLQHIYIEKLLPLLKNADIFSQADSKKPLGYGTSLSLALTTQKLTHDNVYYPTGLGTHGVSDYFELILFNLSSVVHLALYIGSDDRSISQPAISILRKLSESKVFSTKSALSKDLSLRNTRLLSIFENVDESLKIRYAFVQQMEAITDSLQVKYDILEFLLANLPSNGEVTVAHFLLGYETRNGSLTLEEDLDSISLLDTLIQLLMSTIDLIFDIDYSKGYVTRIGLGPSKLASLTMQILVKLSKSPVLSSITLLYIRKYDLSSKLLEVQPKIDDLTIWNNERFQANVQDGAKNNFIEDEGSLEAFFEFMKYRNLILQYLSIEIHEIRSATKKEHYIQMLLNDTEFFNGTPKILNFLDVLNYQFSNFEPHKLLEFENKYNLPALVHELSQEREKKENGTRLLRKFAGLRCQNANQRLRTEDEKAAFSIDMMVEVTRVDELFQKIFVVEELKKRHLQCLQSWVQIIQVLSSDGVADRADFILKVFQYILPKINNDYYERDIMFAEELILLCMLLFDMYEEDSIVKAKPEDGKEQHLQKLLPLFKTCVNGVLCSNSTPALRSDLYILLNKFTQRTPQSGALLHQILTALRSVDRRFINVICNDSIYSEGAPRITSIILMETLVNLSSLEKSTSILNAIVENNSLSLLARLLKRTGELFEACEGNAESGIRIDTLLYELTAFKATLYLLIRIGQSREGASQLFQNEIFPIIRHLKFLNIDSDLGLELQIDTGPNVLGTTSSGYAAAKEESATALITLSLDVPASLADSADSAGGSEKVRTISYYELLVPAFQLVVTVLSAMGPSFQPGIMQARELMQHFRVLVVGVMKRDQLMEQGSLAQYEEKQRLALEGLRQLARLFVLVNALIEDGKLNNGLG